MCSAYEWASRIAKAEKDDEIYSFRTANELRKAMRGVSNVPFRQRVEWLVRRLRDNGHLIAAHGVDQPSTLHYGFGAHEDEVDLIHDIRNRGI